MEPNPSEQRYLSGPELDMLADTAAGRPVARTPEQGISDMRARITFLSNQANSIATRISESPDKAVALQMLLESVKLDLDEAVSRLAEYQLLQQSQN